MSNGCTKRGSLADVMWWLKSTVVALALIISRCHKQLRDKREKVREEIRRFRAFCGSLILSDASFQRRVNDPLATISFSLPLLFSRIGSRRIPSKNKRVPPAWFLQSREGNLHRHRRHSCCRHRHRRNRRGFNAHDAVHLDFRVYAINATENEEAKLRKESLQ